MAELTLVVRNGEKVGKEGRRDIFQPLYLFAFYTDAGYSPKGQPDLK